MKDRAEQEQEMLRPRHMGPPRTGRHKGEQRD